MNSQDIINSLNQKIKLAIDRFITDLKSVRTGRANSSMLDGVTAEVYGSSMPLNQVATIAVMDAQMIQVSPFDPNNLEAISNAIRNNSSLGLNPSDDGRVIRVVVPPLTEDRRREVAKQISQKVEENLVKLRSFRHDAIDAINQSKKNKDIGEDEAGRLEKQVDEAINLGHKEINQLAKDKEKDILTL